MSRLISLIALLACIVIIGILFYKVMIGFLIPLFLAAVLVVIFRPLHRHVLAFCNNKNHIAAAITTTIVACLVLLPAGLAGTFAAIQGVSLARSININSIRVGLAKFREQFDLQTPENFMEHIRSIDQAIDTIQSELNTRSIQELAAPDGQVSNYEQSVRDNVRALAQDYLNSLKGKLEEVEKAYIKNNKDPSAQEQYKQGIEKTLADKSTEIERYLDYRQPMETSSGDDSTAASKEPASNDVIIIELPKDMNGLERIGEPATLAGLRKLLIDLDRATPRASDPEDPGNGADIVALQSRALQLNTEWQTQRTTLLGGTVVGFLREIANPTPKQVRTFLDRAAEKISPTIVDLTGQTTAFLIRLGIGSAIMMVALFFFLYDGPAMIKGLMQLSPLDDEYEMELLGEFDRIVRAIVLALISSAIVQGLTAGIGYYIVGMPGLVFLTLLTTLCALIPFVGPAIVWVPVCIYLSVYEGSYWKAGFLAIWGFLLVGSVDNVVKTLVLHGQSSLHPLLALLSILGGVQALGPIGIVVGPIVVTLLQTLLKILQRELNAIDQTGLSPGLSTIEVGAGSTAQVVSEKGSFPSMIERLRMRAAKFREREGNKSADQPDPPTPGQPEPPSPDQSEPPEDKAG